MAAPIILCDTAGMTNEQWLEARMHGPHEKSRIQSAAVMLLRYSVFLPGLRRWSSGTLKRGA